MILDDLLTYFSGVTGCGTPGVDLFEGELPDMPIAPDLATVINEYGGLPSDVKFGTADVYREWPRVQVAVRSNPRDRASGRSRIETIYRAMGKMPLPTTLSGVAYYTVKLLQPPFPLSRDDKWRTTFAFNAQFYKDPAP